MTQTPCVEKFVRFLEETSGRLSFERVCKLFSKGLDENPVFEDVRRRGGFSKNIMVVLGGRGCGKTLTIRYVKHYFEKDGWRFYYIDGKELATDRGLANLEQTVNTIVGELEKNKEVRTIIAIDDIAEAAVGSQEFLRERLVELVRNYAGRLSLVIAAQSERVTSEGVTTLPLLQSVLGRAPSAEMFLGESPEEVISEALKKSYIGRNPVILLRGAALINLDAFWSTFRSLSRVEELADVIVKIADFYIKNAVDQCNEILEKVKSKKHGLALLALSSFPKVTDPNIKMIVEYAGEAPGMEVGEKPLSLNGIGLAELLRGYIAERHTAEWVEKAQELYNELLKDRVESLDTERAKLAILRASEAVNYIEALEDVPVSTLGISVQQQPQGAGMRKRYGPRADIIHVRRGTQRLSTIIVHCLKRDKKGYVTSASLKKLAELVKLGVPRRAEGRYLVVLLQSKRDLKYFYEGLGFENFSRTGIDVFPLFIDDLTDIERSLMYKLSQLSMGKRDSDYKLNLMRRIFLSTVLFSIRDDTNIPQLAYLLLPYILTGTR